MPDAAPCTILYVASRAQLETGPARHALRALRPACTRLVLVTEPGGERALPEQLTADAVLLCEAVQHSYLAGLQQGVLAETQRDCTRPLLVTGGHVLGPLHPPQTFLDMLERENAAMLAGYWHNTALDHRLSGRHVPHRLPVPDFAIFSPALLRQSGFHQALARLKPSRRYRHDTIQDIIPLARFLEQAGHKVIYPFAADRLKTSMPHLFETHRLVAGPAPCLPLEVFTLDPLIHDQNAVDLRRTMDSLRQRHPELYRVATAYALRHVPLRDFSAITEQFEIFPTRAHQPDKTAWSFGTIAVFIHAYYPEMIDQLAGLVSNIPAPVDLFVSTASETSRRHILDRLEQLGHAAERCDVRVVEHNRGRDMSALFITFRDVILADRHELALRLHSKRTPQVSDRVAEEFRDHLFENLVQGPGYVANLLDRLEAEPDIGLVVPPVIHLGFGTLGHSWFNNRPAVARLLREMGFDMPLDVATPVAPYGTMYWFRTRALRKMFEWPWQWEAYNPEPRHIDGGLAHVQERLIGYCVQGSGYRVLSAMTPQSAARNYARLEYKMQRLASYLPAPDIIGQDQLLAESSGGIRNRLYQASLRSYGRILRRWPGMQPWLHPTARLLRKILRPGRLS